MAFKTNIEVIQHPVMYNYVMYNYVVRFKNLDCSYVERGVSNDDAMLILGAIEQGREEAKVEIRKVLGVK